MALKFPQAARARRLALYREVRAENRPLARLLRRQFKAAQRQLLAEFTGG